MGHRDFRAYGESSASLSWSGSWSLASSTSYIGGKVRSSNSANASASFAFDGDHVAWVAPVGPTRGEARIYLDGVYKGVVNLYAPSFGARRVVYASQVTAGRHHLTIKVVGTAGHPTVAIDALYVGSPA